MKHHLIFIGERRSQRAKLLGVRWQDGALAAKPLFEALRFCGIDPLECTFVNWFDECCHTSVRVAASLGVKVIAMGRKVEKALTNSKIPHIALIHPAARGKIRKRELYIAHVAERLKGIV